MPPKPKTAAINAITALGEKAALAYIEGLRRLYPDHMAAQNVPLIWHSKPSAKLDELLKLLDAVLGQAESKK